MFWLLLFILAWVLGGCLVILTVTVVEYVLSYNRRVFIPLSDAIEMMIAWPLALIGVIIYGLKKPWGWIVVKVCKGSDWLQHRYGHTAFIEIN